MTTSVRRARVVIVTTTTVRRAVAPAGATMTSARLVRVAPAVTMIARAAVARALELDPGLEEALALADRLGARP